MKRYKKLGIKATEVSHLIQYNGKTESGFVECEELMKTECSRCLFKQRNEKPNFSKCCENMLDYLTEDI